MIKSKKEILILIFLCLFVFIIIYLPHIKNPYPLHLDEWHHITEAIKLKQGNLPQGMFGIEAGFHFFLAFISIFFDLVLIYQFLPAIWTVLSALTLFFIIKNKITNPKTGFFIAIFSIIFFASIKSNINILGLWFFTPLTFSIPFIYLYIYFFDKAFEQENKKYLLISLTIMVFLLFIHAISVLFSIPILLIYLLFNLKKSRKLYKPLLLFLLIPIIGILFYKYLLDLTLIQTFAKLINELQFKYGWGVSELNNSAFELYSPIGYILAFIGISFLFQEKYRKKYLIYLLWPIILLIYLIIFKITGKSFFSPYQRNLYYFVLSMPLLSSVGLYWLNKKIKKYKIIQIILIIGIIFLTFFSYFHMPLSIKIYKTINEKDYESLKYLSNFESSKIIAPLLISSAIYPISKHEPVGTTYFYGNQEAVIKFFNPKKTMDCNEKNNIIKEQNVKYVLSKTPINCTWDLIYNKTNYIYEIKNN